MTADEFTRLLLTTIPFRSHGGAYSSGEFYYSFCVSLRIIGADADEMQGINGKHSHDELDYDDNREHNEVCR
jgi:hypothetical protein